MSEHSSMGVGGGGGGGAVNAGGGDSRDGASRRAARERAIADKELLQQLQAENNRLRVSNAKLLHKVNADPLQVVCDRLNELDKRVSLPSFLSLSLSF